MALAANFAAGTAGSAAEQYISTGKVDVKKSVTNGLTNAVSNLIYGTNPLGSAKEAFARGFGAGAATSGINYISDFLGNRQSVTGGTGAGNVSGISGGAVSPYEMLRDPRRGCGSVSPFTPSIGYSSAKGYQYSVPETENVSQSQQKGFSLKDFAVQTIMGGVIGGVTSAAFYGAGKGIEKLKESVQSNKRDSSTIDSRKVYNDYFSNGERKATTKQIRSYKKEMQGKGINVVVDSKGRLLKDNKAAAFDYGSGTIYIKKQAGVIDMYHERYHAEQYLEIGQEAYKNLGQLAREEHVYEQIIKHSELFNDVEIANAGKYITRLRGKLG